MWPICNKIRNRGKYFFPPFFLKHRKSRQEADYLWPVSGTPSAGAFSQDASHGLREHIGHGEEKWNGCWRWRDDNPRIFTAPRMIDAVISRLLRTVLGRSPTFCLWRINILGRPKPSHPGCIRNVMICVQLCCRSPLIVHKCYNWKFIALPGRRVLFPAICLMHLKER